MSIPAAGSGLDDLVETLGIFFLVVISIVGGILQKRLQNKQQRQRKAADDARAGRERPEPLAPAPAKRPSWLQAERSEPPMRPSGAEQTKPVEIPQEVRRIAEAVFGVPLEPRPERRRLRPPSRRHSEKKPAAVQKAPPKRVSEQRQPERPQVAPARPVPHVKLDLGDRRAARLAIIYHEILSPPKALRDEPQAWET